MISLTKLRNILWIFFGKFGIVFFSIFTFIFFALYLTPEELGKGALVIAMIELLSVFCSSMLETPLVRQKALSTTDKASIFWCGAALSLTLSVLLVVLISMLYANGMWMLVAFGCVKFLFSNMSRSYIAELRIQRKFKALAIRTLIGKVCGASVAIAFAYNGVGALSVVVQPVIMEIVSFTILAYTAGIPALRSASSTRFKQVVLEGYTYAIKFSCNTLLERATVIILSITTSLEMVGYYAFARRLVELPRASVQSAINTYAIPAFSSKIDAKLDVASFFKELSFFTFLIFAPIFIWYGLTFSELLVPIFGDKWAASTNVFLALSFVAATRFTDIYVPALLAAHGRSQVGLIKEICNTLMSVLITWFASSYFGIWGAVLASAVYAVMSVLIRFSTVLQVVNVIGVLRLQLLSALPLLLFSLACVYFKLFLFDDIIINLTVFILGFTLFASASMLLHKNILKRAKQLMR